MATTAHLYEALALFQGACPTIPKTRTAKVATKNGSYSYKYADLSDIISTTRPVLERLGLVVHQNVQSDGRTVGVQTIVVHKESGEKFESGWLYLPSGDTPQSAGSAITYARRYQYSAVLGFVTEEDDDGASATAVVGDGYNAGDYEQQQPEKSEPMTDPQRSKIWAQAKELGYDVDALHRVAGVESLSNLTRAQASSLIDLLDANLREARAKG